MLSRISLLLLSFCFCVLSVAQSDLNPCGTVDHRSDWLKNFQRNSGLVDTRGGEKLYVPLSVFVVSTDDGTGEISAEALVGSLCTLNEDFEEANIEFYLQGGFKYLSRSEMYSHDNTTDAAFQMFDLNIANTINCYIVGTAAGNCGYNLPYAGVVLDINCTSPDDHTWAHEIGHNLSLPHPFLGWEGGTGYDGSPVGSAGSTETFAQPAPETVLYNYTLFKDSLLLDTLIIDTAFVEKVDGSNCEFAADGFCDTPPDYLAYRWTCNQAEGTSIGSMLDPNGESFKSDATLIMSYANDECAARFSPEQIEAMRANLLDEKPEYLNNQIPAALIEDPTVTYNFPVEGETQAFDYIELDWEPVENATHYFVQIHLNETLTAPLWQDIVTETSAVGDIIQGFAERDVYWSVAPFTNYEFCTDFQEVQTFFVSNVSSSNDQLIRNWDIVPSVVKAGNAINIESEENLFGGNISVRDLTGKLLLSEKINSNSIDIPYSWSTGIYLVQIQINKQVHTQKIVVR